MGVCGTWKARRDAAAAARTLCDAAEAGFTIFDHADIYAGGACEEAHALARQASAQVRAARVITKAGHVFPPGGSGIPHHYDTTPAHITAACEASLRRLGVARIDLFLVHRPDPIADPGLGEALAGLVRRGLVDQVGVSNFAPWQFERLQAACPVPLVANQIQLSPAVSAAVDDGTLDHACARHLAVMAWSPLAKGVCAEGSTSDDPRLAAVQAALDEVAGRLGFSRSQAALAWIRRHPAGVVPVVGTLAPARMRAALAAVHLDRIDWFRIAHAGRGAGYP
jgi:predicted oxidoreductase